jgi:hypothetical protein
MPGLTGINRSASSGPFLVLLPALFNLPAKGIAGETSASAVFLSLFDKAKKSHRTEMPYTVMCSNALRSMPGDFVAHGTCNCPGSTQKGYGRAMRISG